MEPDETLRLLIICVFVLLALTVVVRYLRLPPEHAEALRRREEIRRMLVKQRVIPSELNKVEIAIEEMNSRNKKD